MWAREREKDVCSWLCDIAISQRQLPSFVKQESERKEDRECEGERQGGSREGERETVREICEFLVV